MVKHAFKIQISSSHGVYYPLEWYSFEKFHIQQLSHFRGFRPLRTPRLSRNDKIIVMRTILN